MNLSMHAKRLRNGVRMKQVRKIRMSRGWSQATLARTAGLHQATVCAVETGRLVPYPSQLAKIAQALGWVSDPAGLLDEVSENDPVA